MKRQLTARHLARAARRLGGRKTRARQRGAMIIGVLFFLLIASVLLVGTGTMTVGHQNLADSDSKYTDALNTAEAGVNYEFRKISQNPNNADLTAGSGYTYGNGKFQVYCTNVDG